MTQDLSSFFKGVDDANPQRSSDWFRGGRYLTQVKQFKVKQNDDGLIYFIFELIVLKCLDPSEAAKEPGGPHGPGHEVSWVQAKHQKPTLPNLKAALMAMTGVPKEDVTMEFCGQCAGPAQPLAGICVEFQNKVVQTKKGTPYTRVTAKRAWSGDEVRESVGDAQLKQLGITLED